MSSGSFDKFSGNPQRIQVDSSQFKASGSRFSHLMSHRAANNRRSHIVGGIFATVSLRLAIVPAHLQNVRAAGMYCFITGLSFDYRDSVRNNATAQDELRIAGILIKCWKSGISRAFQQISLGV
jgi:hypothetical protein